MNRNPFSVPALKPCLVTAFCLLFPVRVLAAAPAPTTTVLTVSLGGSVSVGTALSFKASVTSGGSPVSPGLVLFCNADAQYCEDFNILGQAQLTKNGSASVNLILPIGPYNVRAEFRGTKSYAASASSSQSLTISGRYPSTTNFSVAPLMDNFNLTSTITNYGKAVPTGPVLFRDTANYNIPLASGTLGASSLVFPPVTNTASPSSYVAGAVADVNGDGNLDQLVFDYTYDVVVLFGKGDGTFTTGPVTPLGARPVALAVGDFNNDGIPDFAVTTSGSGAAGDVRVFLGNGDGTFSSTAPIPVGSSIGNVSVGDFNNDGNVDLVVISSLGLSVLLGNGMGGFALAPTPLAASSPSTIRVSDVNGDGNQDLVFANGATVQLYLGNGDGTFVAGSSPPVNCVGSCPDVVVADFNGDGKPDLAVADDGPDDYALGGVLVLLGNGDGTFGASSNVGLGYVVALSLGDFNGDGKADIAAMNLYSYVGILLGGGDGTFTQNGSYTLFTSMSAPVVGDYNNDGMSDYNPPYRIGPVNLAQWQGTVTANGIVVTGSLGIHNVFANYQGDLLHHASSSATVGLQGPKASTSIVLNVAPLPATPGQTLSLVATISPTTVGADSPSGTITFSNGPNALGTVPVAHGQAMLSTSTLPLGNGSNITLTAYYGGDSEFTPSVSLPTVLTSAGALRPGSATVLSVSPSSVAPEESVLTLSASVTENGAPVTSGLVLFYDRIPGNTRETPLGQAQLTSSGMAAIKLRLGIGSHAIRAAFQGTNAVAGGTSAVEAVSVTGLIRTSTAFTSSPPTYSATVTANGPVAAAGDVYFYDGSNKDFIVAAEPLGGSTTNVSFTPVSVPPKLGVGQMAVAVADFNGDGILDIATIENPSGFESPYQLVILLGNAYGQFTEKYSLANLQGDNYWITVADFNGDGIPDIALNGPVNFQGSTAILLGNGDGTFTVNPEQISGFGGIAADFNGDGIPDLETVNNNGNIQIYEGKGDGTFVPSAPSAQVSSFYKAVADFNGDGILDIAFAVGGVTNPIILALGNGDGTFVTKSVPFNSNCGTPFGMTTADFNGDGFPDLLYIDCSMKLWVLLGNGDGSFRTLEVPGQPTPIFFTSSIAGDLNGDGIPDLALTSEGGSVSYVNILYGKGDGGFAIGPELAASVAPEAAAIGDFNGDGVADLLTAEDYSSSMLEWFGAVAKVSQTTPVDAIVPGGGTHEVYAAYNGDATDENSHSASVPVAGTKLGTSTQLTVTSSSGVSPEVFTLTASISPKEYANYSPTGTVTFYSSGVAIASVAVSGGQAVYSAALQPGDYQFSALYHGDNNFIESASVSVGCCASIR